MLCCSLSGEMVMQKRIENRERVLSMWKIQNREVGTKGSVILTLLPKMPPGLDSAFINFFY